MLRNSGAPDLEEMKFFFSEEKKQKTFTPPLLPRWEAMAGIVPRAQK
jgi:hypothetical protein